MSRSAFVDGLIEMANIGAAEHLYRVIHMLDCAPHPLDLNGDRVRVEVEAALKKLALSSGPRFFIDALTTTGDVYMIPADHRGDWDAFDIACEETSEVLPVPDWARPIEQLSHVEFEMPEEVFK